MRSRTNRIATGALAITIATLVAVTLAACGASSGSSNSSAKTLRVVASGTISTLNPVLNGTGPPNVFFLDAAYAPLIRRAGDGSLKPALATSWKYLDNENTKFQIVLRKNVKFSDGTPLTAEGLKKWFEYNSSAPGALFANEFAGITSIDVTGSDTVVLNLAASDPLWPTRLTQNRYGHVISAAALKDPSKLGTTTVGAGPYTIDTSATVTGSTYTYVPNKYYYDKSAVHYSKVVITVITDPNAVLSSIRSGQQDFAVGQARSADAAKSAGVQVTSVPLQWNALLFFDRNGQVVPALKNVEVRQALNYAVDRSAVTKAVFGKYAQPNVAMVLPGFDSYSKAAENAYTYDPAKAKKMLADAGYPDGFSMDAYVWNRQGDESTFSQALQGELAKVGVTMNLVSAGDGSTAINTIFSKKYPVFPFFGQAEEANQNVGEQLRDPGVANPFGVDDPGLDALYDKVQSAPADQQAAAQQALQLYVVKQALYLPVSISDAVYFTGKGTTGLSVSNAQPTPDILDLKPGSEQ